MRLSLTVNGRPIAKASLVSNGWLGAHVILRQGGGPSEPANRVWLDSTDTSGEPNTEHSGWGSEELSVGDKIEIEVLPDGESDPPSTVTRTSESPNNLFSNVEQARLLLAAIKICDTTLSEVADRARAAEPDDEFRKVATAIGSVLAELDQRLISPTLRRHPELITIAQEMKLW